MVQGAIKSEVEKFRKPAYDIDAVYLNRWSPRSFLEKEIPEQELFSILEAARWAPSANNLQPWRFIIARTKEDRETFLSFISEGNAVWCKKAPVFLLVISKTSSERGPIRTHAFDTGAAWGYLALEAVNKGLVTHPMGGFDRGKARELLNIPEEYELHAVIAVGYQGEKEALPESHQEREQPSTRKPLNELIIEGKF